MRSTDFISRFSGLNLGNARRLVKTLFAEAGLETAAIDARLLLQHATGYSHSMLIGQNQDIITADAVKTLNGFCQRRLKGEPVDKILGFRAFHNYTFKVTHDVLSPRPETEALVDIALEVLVDSPAPKILDLGTGSGAILISLLAELETAIGIGTDISSKALMIAKLNAKANGVASRLSLLEGSWFDAVSRFENEKTREATVFDVIISNPPYIASKAMLALDIDVLNYDPRLALHGGKDGLDAYRVIIGSAAEYMKSEGVLLLEIGFDQGDSVSNLLKQAGYRHIRLQKDGAGHDRILSATRP